MIVSKNFFLLGDLVLKIWSRIMLVKVNIFNQVWIRFQQGLGTSLELSGLLAGGINIRRQEVQLAGLILTQEGVPGDGSDDGEPIRRFTVGSNIQVWLLEQVRGNTVLLPGVEVVIQEEVESLDSLDISEDSLLADKSSLIDCQHGFNLNSDIFS